ncbi:MAG: PKD domain-containing protein [Bacteroidia bacterium]
MKNYIIKSKIIHLRNVIAVIVLSSIFLLNACAGDEIILDDVSNPPELDFSFEITFTQVKFTNLSKNYDKLYWDFGDGTVDSVINPVHEYKTKGTYTVTLKSGKGINERELEKTVIILNENSLFEPLFNHSSSNVQYDVFSVGNVQSGEELKHSSIIIASDDQFNNRFGGIEKIVISRDTFEFKNGVIDLTDIFSTSDYVGFAILGLKPKSKYYIRFTHIYKQNGGLVYDTVTKDTTINTANFYSIDAKTGYAFEVTPYHNFKIFSNNNAIDSDLVNYEIKAYYDKYYQNEVSFNDIYKDEKGNWYFRRFTSATNYIKCRVTSKRYTDVFSEDTISFAQPYKCYTATRSLRTNNVTRVKRANGYHIQAEFDYGRKLVLNLVNPEPLNTGFVLQSTEDSLLNYAYYVDKIGVKHKLSSLYDCKLLVWEVGDWICLYPETDRKLNGIRDDLYFENIYSLNDLVLSIKK